MSQIAVTRDELVALFAAKANAPTPESDQLLVRHLQCKESVHLAGVVSEALARYAQNSNPCLLVPSELLPPLA